MDNPLLGEIALRCNDVAYKDFSKSIHERCFLRASRRVARRYHLIQRVYDFKIEIPNYENLDNDKKEERLGRNSILYLPSFTAEYMVKINDYEYSKVKRINANNYEYVLYRDENKILFNYSPRSKSDKIEIRYTADINIEDYDVEEIQPIIPSQYNEELISLACVEVARLGIVKFKSSEEGNKYTKVLQLYSMDEEQLNKNLIKNDDWVEIKTWSPY